MARRFPWRRSLIFVFHPLCSALGASFYMVLTLRSLYKTADCRFQLCSRFATLLWKVSWSDLGGPSAKDANGIVFQSLELFLYLPVGITCSFFVVFSGHAQEPGYVGDVLWVRGCSCVFVARLVLLKTWKLSARRRTNWGASHLNCSVKLFSPILSLKWWVNR